MLSAQRYVSLLHPGPHCHNPPHILINIFAGGVRVCPECQNRGQVNSCHMTTTSSGRESERDFSHLQCGSSYATPMFHNMVDLEITSTGMTLFPPTK